MNEKLEVKNKMDGVKILGTTKEINHPAAPAVSYTSRRFWTGACLDHILRLFDLLLSDFV
jgi:hypothetical protein